MKKHRTKVLNSSFYTSMTHLKQEMIRRARYRAKKRKIDFNIKVKDLTIPTFCPLLKERLVVGTNMAPSLDRVDNNKGYVVGNIKVISVLANNMKASASEKQLLTFSKNIKKYLCQK